MTALVQDWSPGFPLDVALTLAVLGNGRSDPTHRRAPDGAIWRVSLLPSGPVTYRLSVPVPGTVRMQAWGAGAEEMRGRLPDLLGARDRPETFVAAHPVLQKAERRLAGLRIPCTGLLWEALASAVLHQKIQGRDAQSTWTALVRRHGTSAPGPAGWDGPVPAGLMAVPPPARWADIPQWDWRRAGAEPQAERLIRTLAPLGSRLERLAAAALSAGDPAAGDPAPVYRALTSIRGIGVWTAAEVGHRALGDADALPLGDYHLADMTGYALAGRQLAAEEVEAFYEQWRPHRYRVMRLLELTPEARPPRRGPRLSRPEHRYAPY